MPCHPQVRVSTEHSGFKSLLLGGPLFRDRPLKERLQYDPPPNEAAGAHPSSLGNLPRIRANGEPAFLMNEGQ